MSAAIKVLVGAVAGFVAGNVVSLGYMYLLILVYFESDPPDLARLPLRAIPILGALLGAFAGWMLTRRARRRAEGGNADDNQEGRQRLG